jgi:hypothetical protein
MSNQSILLLNSLYSNASTCVKWNGNISEPFTIEQGVRQCVVVVITGILLLLIVQNSEPISTNFGDITGKITRLVGCISISFYHLT